MKNTKRILVLIFILITIVLLGFEFYIWRGHGYAPHYNEIQDCIEQGGAWEEDRKICQPVK
jgi:hypothetical protein